MYCPYCGVEISDASGFCPSCGAELGEAAGVPEEYLEDKVRESDEVLATESDAAQGDKDMPNPGTYVALIVVGFLCGIIWGVIGATQYGALKSAVEQGDVETARRKAGVIRAVTIVGIVLNLMVLMGYAAGRR